MGEVRPKPALADSLAGHEVFDVTIGGLLREVAARIPDTEALVEGLPDGSAGRRWTFAELLADAERQARSLAGRYRPGERIAV
jgi:fatty-acyl-CoA synthase